MHSFLVFHRQFTGELCLEVFLKDIHTIDDNLMIQSFSARLDYNLNTMGHLRAPLTEAHCVVYVFEVYVGHLPNSVISANKLFCRQINCPVPSFMFGDRSRMQMPACFIFVSPVQSKKNTAL